MRNVFEDDLARWESGDITLEELEVRYPEYDVRGISDIWTQLHAAGGRPTPDPRPSWVVLRERLPEQTKRVITSRPARRFAVVSSVAAAVLAITAISYAAGAPQVRRTVDGIVNKIVVMFDADVVKKPEIWTVEDEHGSRGGPMSRRGPSTGGPGPDDPTTRGVSATASPSPVRTTAPTQNQWTSVTSTDTTSRERSTPRPRVTPRPRPTEEPTPTATPAPTSAPSPAPTAAPTAEPTAEPQASPSTLEPTSGGDPPS